MFRLCALPQRRVGQLCCSELAGQSLCSRLLEGRCRAETRAGWAEGSLVRELLQSYWPPAGAEERLCSEQQSWPTLLCVSERRAGGRASTQTNKQTNKKTKQVTDLIGDIKRLCDLTYDDTVDLHMSLCDIISQYFLKEVFKLGFWTFKLHCYTRFVHYGALS